MRALLLTVVVASGLAGCVEAAAAADDAPAGAVEEQREAVRLGSTGGGKTKGEEVEAVVDADTADDVIVPSCEVVVLRQECAMGHCVALLKRHC